MGFLDWVKNHPYWATILFIIALLLAFIIGNIVGVVVFIVVCVAFVTYAVIRYGRGSSSELEKYP